MSVPHNHHDWIMHLFAVGKLKKKIKLHLKNKSVFSSQRDARILCKHTYAQLAVCKIFLKHIWSIKAIAQTSVMFPNKRLRETFFLPGPGLVPDLAGPDTDVGRLRPAAQ